MQRFHSDFEQELKKRDAMIRKYNRKIENLRQILASYGHYFDKSVDYENLVERSTEVLDKKLNEGCWYFLKLSPSLIPSILFVNYGLSCLLPITHFWWPIITPQPWLTSSSFFWFIHYYHKINYFGCLGNLKMKVILTQDSPDFTPLFPFPPNYK